MNKRYLIKRSLGRGGMGEIFLVYDKETKRHVALKKIRDDLKKNPVIKKRFLREAKIASLLSHPSIIPIYDIHFEEPYFYTMPYVEGKTLKDILKTTKLDPSHPIGSSIATLIRLFLNVCEAIAYVHSKNVLHRDLKPENIIIGKYGEVLILDWGIAKFINEKEVKKELKIMENDIELTALGKVTGTINYMAPERVFEKKATVLGDIYSLGSILYQILTLESPFKRKDLKTFKKKLNLEEILDPIEKKTNRDIPKKLSDICMKCLAKEKEKRYQSVEDLIFDLKDFIDGKSQWILNANLDINKQNDWQFNENIYLAKYQAAFTNTEFSDWLRLMVCKLAFSGNIKIEAEISLNKESKGLGFLLNILKKQNNFKIHEGYKIWFNLNKNKTEISKSNVLIFKNNLNIKANTFYQITIEKMDDILNIYLDNKLIFSYRNHLPLRGDFFAIAFKDTFFSIKNLKIYTSSYKVMVNCLAIGDAFFDKEDYDTAIEEYRKITFSFPNRKEGLEAIFRAGISFLEKAKKIKNSLKKEKYLDQSLEEFQKMHYTSFEPLEYLGKSLTYLEKKDYLEEAKCLELMIRKFKGHHQMPILKEYILYRMHQSSSHDRESSYRIILIALRFIPDIMQHIDFKNFLNYLKDNLEKLYFLENSKNMIHFLSINLAFILNKTNALLEIMETKDLENINIENIIFSLLELNEIKKAEIALDKNKEKINKNTFNLLKSIFTNNTEKAFNALICKVSKKITKKELKNLIYLLKKLIDEKKSKAILNSEKILLKLFLDEDAKALIDSIIARAYFMEKKIDSAADILKRYSKKELDKKNSPIYFLYGLWLYKKKGKKSLKNFFVDTDKDFLFSNELFSYYISNKNKSVSKKAFDFEKKQLHRDIFLYNSLLKK